MAESYDDPSHAPLSDRVLPPVEPPSARFIVQLFVVPGVIVTIIVLVWLLFNWLAEMGSDPSKYVKVLASNSKARWQAAENLAVVLNDKDNVTLKRDRALAGQLAALLTAELNKPNDSQEQAWLEAYLCRALGLFEVPEAVPPLVEAASRSDLPNIAVRRAALEGLALVASNLPAADNTFQSDMDAALHKAAVDSDPQIRCVAAFALGVEGSEAANEQLRAMLSDVYPDVRYNAAAGLARHGNPAGFEVILEMLDPTETPPPSAETEQESGDFKHQLIIGSGLQATATIAAALDEPARQSLRQAVERLQGEEQSQEIRLKAADTLRKLDAAAPHAGGS